jgi:hypothetical protein
MGTDDPWKVLAPPRAHPSTPADPPPSMTPFVALCIVGALMLVVACAIAWVLPPRFFGHAAGFPPGWTCTNYGKGGYVCDREPPPAPASDAQQRIGPPPSSEPQAQP